jgi:hypothetical protein
VTSFAFMVAQSFQATMKREKSSSTVERSGWKITVRAGAGIRAR